MPNYLVKGEQLISLKPLSGIKKAPEGFFFYLVAGARFELATFGL
jgi:hypothetical protein